MTYITIPVPSMKLQNTTLLAEAVNAHSNEACPRPGRVPTLLAQPIAIVEHHAVAEKIQHVSLHDYDVGLIENKVPSQLK